jgi:hypothetical protein
MQASAGQAPAPVPPAPSFSAQSGNPGIAPPAPTNLPQTPPAWVPGNAYSTNAIWANRVATEYNPIMNQNLMDNYNQQLANYAQNGNKRWVGGTDTGHWITDAPVAPIFTNTDYNDQFQYANENLPGLKEYGGTSMGSNGFLDAYTKQDPSYFGTLPQFTTQNTNLNPGYTSMIPNTGFVPTVTNPNGMSPGQVAGTGFIRPGTTLNNQGATLTQPQNPLGQSGQLGQLGQSNGSMSGLANMTSLLSLLALLGGQPQQAASPFFNNQRSLFYPNTSQGDAATSAFNQLYGGQGPSQAQGSTNPILQLLTQLLASK